MLLCRSSAALDADFVVAVVVVLLFLWAQSVQNEGAEAVVVKSALSSSIPSLKLLS